MSVLYTATVVLEVRECPVCFVTYGVPQELLERRRREGGDWWCPNGHSVHFTETTEQRLRNQLKERDRLIANVRESRDAAERSARATRGHVTRLKKRMAAGKCPACSHDVPDLAEHIAEAHPGYGHDKETR